MVIFMKIQERLAALRRVMVQQGIDIYYIPTNDFHGSEYLADYFKCREYMSGFSGSAGDLVVTKEEAGLWTDGRYFIQAENQLAGSGISLYKMSEPSVPKLLDFVKERLQKGDRIGFDGRVVSALFARGLKKIAQKAGASVVNNIDLVGEIWEGRPELPVHPAYSLDVEYAGVCRSRKLEQVYRWLKDRHVDMLVITALDDIAWLLNIRGGDIHCSPVVMGYLVVRSGQCILFARGKAFSTQLREELAKDGVTLREYDEIYGYLAGLQEGGSAALDLRIVNDRLIQSFPKDIKIINMANPTKLAKAVKNPVEIDGERAAHIKDGVALVRFICWLKKNIREMPLTEITAARKLESFRSSMQDYVGPSFEPIAAYGPHGAIVHYSASEETDVCLRPEGFLLLDTGGHYLQGTTDVTRTILLGDTATQEQKMYYTAVLQGNLRLAAAKFRAGCSGVALDILARQPLWEMGCDYSHGTGHGVGCLLNVHEGPNAIRYRIVSQPDGNIPLQPGMVTSDEPGIYLEGKFGIRLESLLLCVQKERNDFGEFLGFETLTMVPFEREAIAVEMLTQQDKKLLNSYHARVYDALSPYLEDEEAAWLMDACAGIE